MGGMTPKHGGSKWRKRENSPVASWGEK